MPDRFYEIAAPNLCCTLCADGASIAGVRTRNARGAFVEVALSPESFLDGSVDPSLAGRTIGPCCGRVRGGEAVIGERPLRLIRNEGMNHLHGGPGGCAWRRWEVETTSPTRVRFALTLPDGLDGYPGNRRLHAEYAVAGNILSVIYTATTDATTWIDLTNHVYWDLGGRFDGSAMRQTLELAARRVVRNDSSHLPVEIADAVGAFDFSAPCALSGKLAGHPGDAQLQIARGFNNAFLLDPGLRESKGFAARLCSPDSGIRMTMDTDQPAIVLYTGGFLGGDTALRTAPGTASPGCAIALEAQGLPDPFHLPGAEAVPLQSGETWRREIRWHFEA